MTSRLHPVLFPSCLSVCPSCTHNLPFISSCSDFLRTLIFPSYFLPRPAGSSRPWVISFNSLQYLSIYLIHLSFSSVYILCPSQQPIYLPTYLFLCLSISICLSFHLPPPLLLPSTSFPRFPSCSPQTHSRFL